MRVLHEHGAKDAEGRVCEDGRQHVRRVHAKRASLGVCMHARKVARRQDASEGRMYRSTCACEESSHEDEHVCEDGSQHVRRVHAKKASLGVCMHARKVARRQDASEGRMYRSTRACKESSHEDEHVAKDTCARRAARKVASTKGRQSARRVAPQRGQHAYWTRSDSARRQQHGARDDGSRGSRTRVDGSTARPAARVT